MTLLPALASATPVEGLEWSWDAETTRSYYVGVEVMLPGPLWVLAEHNKEARLVYFSTQVIMDCGDAEPASKKAWEFECRIKDFSIRAAAMTGDRDLLLPILEEMDENITGARLQVVRRKDGKVTNVDLEDVQKSNRRTSRMQETMRIILARSVAGMDLQLPRKGASPEGVWGQFSSMIMSAPTDRGSHSSVEMAHLVREVQDDLVIIETAGKGMVSPATDSMAVNFYETELESVSVFDTTHGLLRERVWGSVGTPTASSAAAEGGSGYSYFQQGKLSLLGDGIEPPEILPTEEIKPPEEEPTSLEGWSPLNPSPPK